MRRRRQLEPKLKPSERETGEDAGHPKTTSGRGERRREAAPESAVAARKEWEVTIARRGDATIGRQRGKYVCIERRQRISISTHRRVMT